MADRIRLLPEIVANQIAAGEVVNRPSSVVKEMMENAIDAGAQRVKVNFRDGGKELIQIVDDGCGMSPIDARLAFDRHATSKIRSVEDIYALSTFGFRGEALASIAAVAQVELLTRQQGDEVGTATRINGGQFVSQEPAACPVGSQFFVRNLFYNVPARRRFLDKSTASASQIKAEFQRVALCNPRVAFELYANDAPLYRLEAASAAGRIVDVVGRHIKQNLLEVGADTSIASVAGFIGRPAAAKRRNTEQYLFVNGRYFKSAYLSSAILKAYEKLIPEGAQPSYFLYLTLDPERIDVNVHPQKTEVKFADETAVWQIVNAAVRETLARTGAVPMMDFDDEAAVEIPVLERGAVYAEPRATSDEGYNPFREEYIDPSAPDPNVDFAGFDIPAAGGRTVADREAGAGGYELRGSGSGGRGPTDRASAGRGAVGLGSAGQAEEAFDDFVGFGGFGALADGAPEQFEEFVSGGGEAGEEAGGAVFEASDAFGAAGGSDASDVSGASGVSGVSGAFGASAPESVLDFIPSEAMTEGGQRLELAGGEPVVFRDPLPLGGGYVAALVEGRLAVVDVRRARERVIYEDCLAMLGSGAAVSQRLLFPERLQLSDDEYASVGEHAVELAALGFDLELAGDGVVEVLGTPADQSADAVDRLLYDLLQAFATPVSLEELRRERIAAAMARHAARGALGTLTREEAAALLDRLAATGHVAYTPAGKAIFAQITAEEIRQRLG